MSKPLSPQKSKKTICLNPKTLPSWITKPRKKKNPITRPHYRATTKDREDGPSRRRTPTRSTHSRRITQGGDIELVRLLLDDNQRLRETIVDLAKHFPQSSTNQDDIELFTRRSPRARNKTHHDSPQAPKERKKGMEIMATAMEKNLPTPTIRASNLKGQVLQESAFF